MRRSGYYLWKIVLIQFLLVILGWPLFFLEEDQFTDRYGALSTLILTLTAFLYVMSGKLPSVPYLTLLDKVRRWSAAQSELAGLDQSHC